MILLLAGEIACGKTSVARSLAEYGFQVVSARVALADMTGADPNDRIELQRRGAEIDRRTAGRWLLEYLGERVIEDRVVVDSLRTRRQTEPILERFVDSRLAFLDASEDTRRHRYAGARELDPVKGSATFARASSHPTEAEARMLRPMAHAVIETDEATPGELAHLILESLQWSRELGLE